MIFIKQRFFGFLAVLLFFGNAALFADRNPVFTLPGPLYGALGLPDDPVPAKAALRQGVLPNGLRYYILENSLPADRAYLTLAVNAGSVLENDDERGLAHFVEHMAFNGTRRFPGTELVNYLRSLGMRFGPEINAYTGYDETVYGIEAPVEKGEDGIKRIPERALAILDDWTWTVTFNSQDVAKERAIIMEEYRSGLGAEERVRRQILPLIYRGSRYADRNPIGLPEIIQNVTAEQLTNFYQTWYRPDNMAIILAGDFDGAEMEQRLASHFSAPPPETPFVRPAYDLPGPQRGNLTIGIVTDPELPFSTVYLYYKRSPQALEKTLRTYRENLIDYLIEEMIDFRVEQAVSGEDNPYMAAGNWGSRFGRNSRYYIMAAQSKAGRTGDTLRALLLEKERLVRYGFSRTELDRAKGSLLSDLEQMEAEKDRQESEAYVSELTGDFLRNEFALDLDWEMEAVTELLPGIGLVTVNKAVRSYYADDDLAVLVAAPEAELSLLPDQDDIRTLVEESRTIELSPRREEKAPPVLVDYVPAPGTILEFWRDESGAEIWNLSNGMNLVLMETANKNNELSIYALAKGGTVGAAGPAAGFSQEQRFSAELAAEIQSASGLGPFSRTELIDFLSDKQVSLSFWTSSYIRGFQGFSTVKDLETFFQMLYTGFVRPRIDQAGLKLVLDQYRTQLIQGADNPNSFFFRELTRTMYNNHPLFKPLEIDDLDKVSAEAAAAFLSRSLNPQDYTLVLAGSLGDREKLRSLTETWLASIPPAAERYQEWADPEITRPGRIEKIIRKGREERSIVYMGWFVPKSWTEGDNAAALVLNEYLDIVLNDEIRETMGGVYSINAELSHSVMPRGELALNIYFICDPGRETELRQAVRKRLAALAVTGGIDAETLTRAKEALVKTFERSMANNGFVARNLANFMLITDTPLSHLIQRPALYSAVSAEQIQAAVAALLAEGPAELVLLPETADN
jgi:zinc protease